MTLTNLICYHAIMDYKLLHVDDKRWPCFHEHFFKRLSEWLTLDQKFRKKNCFTNLIRSKRLSHVVSLCTEFFQFDTCGCQISLVPYQEKAQFCNHLCLVIIPHKLCCFRFLCIFFPS